MTLSDAALLWWVNSSSAFALAAEARLGIISSIGLDIVYIDQIVGSKGHFVERLFDRQNILRELRLVISLLFPSCAAKGDYFK